MTEQEKQKLKDALIEAKRIHPTEYNDEDAFVGICFSDLVDIINNVMNNTVWHSTSELPVEEGEYIAINDGMPGVFYVNYLKSFGWCVEVMGEYEVVNVKQWCYPPEKED